MLNFYMASWLVRSLSKFVICGLLRRRSHIWIRQQSLRLSMRRPWRLTMLIMLTMER